MFSEVILPVVFVVVIILMLFNFNRTLITLCGGVIAVITVMIDPPFIGFTFGDIMSFLFGNTVDGFSNFHTIVLIFGLLIITSICNDSGVFSFIALKIIQRSQGNKYVLLFFLCALAFLISLMLNNILSMIILIPLTITVCRILMLNPVPYLICQMIVANTGCLVFEISSFSNVLVGEAVPWTFTQFFSDVGLFSFLLFAVVVIALALMYKARLDTPKQKVVQVLQAYNAWQFVKNKALFYLSLLTLIITIILFITLPNFGIKMDIIAITAGMLLLISTGKNIENFLTKLDFQLIIYLLGIFLIVGAMQSTGILDSVAEGIKNITAGDPLSTSLIILWLAGGLTSGIDNIPLAKIFIPITQHFGFTSSNRDLVFTALVYGIHLGDNFLPQGDNIIVAFQITKSYDQKIPVKEFFRIGPLIALIQLGTVSLFLMVLSNHEILIIVLTLVLIIFVIIALIELYRHQTSKFLRKDFLIA